MNYGKVEERSSSRSRFPSTARRAATSAILTDILSRSDRAPTSRTAEARPGWGAGFIQQYLRTGLINELHVAISPVLLGRGERLFEGIDMRALGYECVQFVASEKATHVVLRRQGHRDH